MMVERYFRTRYFVAFLLSNSLIYSVLSYKIFQSKIPNGANIPHPCDPSRIWNGVGHQNSAGAGNRNPFGQDFERLGKIWDKTLCEKDSDGDGRTNGQELGDPDCEWSEEQIPKYVTGLSHPGVCDIWNSVKCQKNNSWLKCDSEKFTCDAIKEDGVKNITLRLPLTKVPNKETTYMCMKFKLPSDGDYHIIAEEPVIDNDYVLHHIVLFGCEYSDTAMNHTREMIENVLENVFENMGILNPFMPKPFECNMIPDSTCKDILTIWSFGSSGHCGTSHAGYRMGFQGYRYAAIQVQTGRDIHWNNPEKQDTYFDSSGLVLYYTPNLKPNDAGILTIGQYYFEIPPEKEKYEVTAKCNHECTTMMITSSINLIEGMNHMHYLGKSGKVEVFRNGQRHKEITNDLFYTYDNPVVHQYDMPIEIRPGDEIKTTCMFKSVSKNHTTYFGEDTSSEMCFAFLSYYPRQNLLENTCLSWKTLPYCKLYGNVSTLFEELNGCNLTDIRSIKSEFLTDILGRIVSHCTPHVCTPECIPIVKEFFDNPCFQGELGFYNRHAMYQFSSHAADYYYSRIDPCTQFNATENRHNTTDNSSNYTVSTSNSTEFISAETMHASTYDLSTTNYTMPPSVGTTLNVDDQSTHTQTSTVAYGKGRSNDSSVIVVLTLSSIFLVMSYILQI